MSEWLRVRRPRRLSTLDRIESRMTEEARTSGILKLHVGRHDRRGHGQREKERAKHLVCVCDGDELDGSGSSESGD